MVKPFTATLQEHNLTLRRQQTTTLQVNVGLRCNLACHHCHLACGPQRKEMMSRKTMDDVIAFADRNSFELADITGGAPELVPDLPYLIANLASRVGGLLLRSNLTVLLDEDKSDILRTVIDTKTAIVASFPSINERQADSQRGEGIWRRSIASLRRLNELGFGMEGSNLKLYLVSNPTGAFLPTDQCQAEKKFAADLARKWDIHFTNLFLFANVPLGRFKDWLKTTGNYDKYLTKLAASFNPETVAGLMCRSLINVSWNGLLYDCDFNQAAGLPFGSHRTHIADIESLPLDTPVATDIHCYSCTAGAGFT